MILSTYSPQISTIKMLKCYIRSDGENEWSIYGNGFPVGTDPNHALAFYRD